MIKKVSKRKKELFFSSNNKGVTLIALVLTIIVLIILAGVSITALTGENGIIGQAKDAKDDTRIATIKESADLWKVHKEGKNAKTLSDVANDLKGKKVISHEEANELNKLGQITVKRKNGNEEVIIFDEGKVADRESIILRYNTGSDGIVDLPWFCMDIPYECTNDELKLLYKNQNINYTVKWDDKTSEERGVSHAYAPNTTVDVKISGNINYMYQYRNEKLTEVRSWGETGLEEFSFYGCFNLINIAYPSNRSFEKMKRFAACEDSSYSNSIYGSFQRTGISEIPEGIFDNCPNVTSFESTFSNSCITKINDKLFDKCPNVIDFNSTFYETNITEIPLGLFDKCPNVKKFNYTFSRTDITEIPPELFNKCQNVTSFIGTFSSCNFLSGEVPKLWETCSNKDTYDSKDPDGRGCYGNLEPTKIIDYEFIPGYWTFYEE